MDKRNIIITFIYTNKDIEKYCKTLSKDWEELRSELILQLYKMKEQTLNRAYDKKYLIYVSMTICKRLKYGTIGDSSLYKNDKYINIDDSPVEMKEQDDFTEIYEEELRKHFELNTKVEQIYKELSTLHWYNAAIFNYYYKDDMKLREISELTGINIKSISNNLCKTRTLIKNKLTK